MPWRSEVVGNGAIRGQKPLSMSHRLKPLHTIFALPRGPVRVLTPGIERATLAVCDPGQERALRRAVALELIRDDDPWYVLQPFE